MRPGLLRKVCFEANTGRTQSWEMTLPVVRCDGGNVDNCVEVISAVTVNILHMTDANPVPAEAPDVLTKPDAENFPDWDESEDCDFYYQLADEVNTFYSAALLPDNNDNNSTALANNFQSTVLYYLPGEDYDASIDPWLIDDRWDGASSTKVYDAGMAKWDCFVDHFNMKNSDGTLAPLVLKSMYFKPDCEYHKPKGTTNGPNFGIRAKYPVLVD